MKVICILYVICLSCLSLGKNIFEELNINFKLNPINNHEFKRHSKETDHNSTICIRNIIMSSNPLEFQLIKLNIENIIPKYTNIDRFGGSSDSNGKQYIQLSIRSLPSGNLVRFKRYLKGGESNILFNVLNLNDTIIETCLINLSYDASWNLFNVDKLIQFESNFLKQEKENIELFYQRTVTKRHFLAVNDILQDLREINSHWKDPIWNKLQNQRREYNENTFTWMLYQLLVLLLCLCGNFIYIVWRLENN